jgi:hypothetical protein
LGIFWGRLMGFSGLPGAMRSTETLNGGHQGVTLGPRWAPGRCVGSLPASVTIAPALRFSPTPFFCVMSLALEGLPSMVRSDQTRPAADARFVGQSGRQPGPPPTKPTAPWSGL